MPTNKPSDQFLLRVLRRLTVPLAQTLSSNIRSRIDDLEKTIHTAQLEINHQQYVLLDEIDRKVKNSGTLVLSESEMVTKIFSGLKMYLDPRDIVLTPQLALDSIWEHRVTIAWLQVVKPNFTILDIGSNFGYFGAIAAQITDRKRSKIVHFEANPHLTPYIHKTLDANWLNEQSVVENVAVADKDGELTLHVMKNYMGNSSVHSMEDISTYMGNKMEIKEEAAIKVPAVAIDTYCKAHDIKKVDLIKMDIEGFEDKAYLGMRGIVKASPNISMFIEFTKEGYKQPEKFYDQLLEDFGHVYVIDDEGYIVKPKKTDYQTVIGDSDDWVMPIFSKRSDLNNR